MTLLLINQIKACGKYEIIFFLTDLSHTLFQKVINSFLKFIITFMFQQTRVKGSCIKMICNQQLG